jgi:gamma-glutamyl-gamma-aminobutyrate hydrolase PuuD
MSALRALPRLPRPAAPLIGVVTHELRAEADPAWAATPGRSERDRAPARLALRLSYTQAVQEAGGLAVVVPAHGYVDDTAALLDRLDGLLFSGGPDLDPAVYQGADAIGAGLEVCARAPDGTVEALSDPAACFCLGVQWHAELLTHDARQAALLDGLLTAARGAVPRLALAA